MNIPLIDLKAQYKEIKNEIDEAVSKVFSNCNFIMGEEVSEFEKSFAEYIGVKHAISVGNGTDALTIALNALNIGKDDEVITTPFTFIATAESIAAVGATPVFADVDRYTFNIDVKKIEEKITKRTKAIMPVHIFGQPCNMAEIMRLAKAYKIKVIEDACQAVGSEYMGKKIGSFGDAACFSFFPTKNLSCAGDGGIITTDDDNVAIMAKALRAHGSGGSGKAAYKLVNGNINYELSDKTGDNTIYNPDKYYNFLIGYNSRLDTLQAAILNVKLKYIDKWNEKRIATAEYYNKNLTNKAVILPFKASNAKHAYHMYILQSDDRNEIVSMLNKSGISTGVYYPIPLHLQKALKYLNYKSGDLPISEYLADRTFAIPIYPELTKEQIDYIVSTINSI